MPYGYSSSLMFLFHLTPSPSSGIPPSGVLPVSCRLFPLQPGYVITRCADACDISAAAAIMTDSVFMIMGCGT